MYIYHVLMNTLSAHTIHINLNTIFYTDIEHSPTKTIYIRYYMETHTQITLKCSSLVTFKLVLKYKLSHISHLKADH